jgi:hypothetical protein
VKLLFFDDWKLGVLKGNSVVDVSAAVQSIPHTGPHDLISGLITAKDAGEPLSDDELLSMILLLGVFRSNSSSPFPAEFFR